MLMACGRQQGGGDLSHVDGRSKILIFLWTS